MTTTSDLKTDHVQVLCVNISEIVYPLGTLSNAWLFCQPGEHWHLGLGSVPSVRFLLLKFQIQNNKLPWQELTHTPRRREQNLITEHRVTFRYFVVKKARIQEYAKLDTGLEFGVCFSIYSRNYLSDIASE